MEEKIKISIASDHAGYKLKEHLKNYLGEFDFLIKDYGTFSENSVDYPDYVHPLASDINKGIFQKGIIICGSGNGVAMTANKYVNVRAAVCWNEEIAKLARKHNDANIISLPARFITQEEAEKIISVFFNTDFEGGRHTLRIEKIKKIMQ